jgi:hypothetical protein
VAVEAEAEGEELRFVVLEDTVVVEGDAELPDAFGTALDGRLDPPYRVVAVPQAAGIWALGARRIETALLEGVPGDTIDLGVGEDGATVLVDGERHFGSLAALERLGRERGLEHFAIHAERLDGDLWDVQVAPL